MNWLPDWWWEFWYVPVTVQRNTMGGNLRGSIKRVPRIGFRRGIDHCHYADRRGIGVYWSPRKVVWEGEITYQHYVQFTWPRLFGLDWQ